MKFGFIGYFKIVLILSFYILLFLTLMIHFILVFYFIVYQESCLLIGTIIYILV